jgi:ABC-type glycerol-3-phosphate transport system substrate-binding protein
MKNVVKKVMALLLVLVFCLSVVGCSSDKKSTETTSNNTDEAGTSTDATEATEEVAEESKEPVEITFSVMNTTNEVPGWTAMVEAANAKLAADGSNVTIKIVKEAAADWPEYYQKVVTQMAAGKAPDIARIANSYMPTVVNKGQAVDITSYVESDLNLDDYFAESLKGANYVDGKYYGLPSGIYYMLMYYNKDLFDAAGLAYPSSDWSNAITFDELTATAKQLTVGDGATKQFGFSAGPYMAYMGMYSLSNGGVNVFNEDGSCALNSDATKKVYSWFDNMLRVDQSMPRPTETKIMGAWDMFKAGRVAMIVEGTWYLSDVKNNIKDFNVGIAAIPAGNGKAYSSMFVDDFFICKGTKHEAEAWEALNALYSEEAWSALAATSVGGLPINRAVLDANVNSLLGGNVSDTDIKAFKEGLDHVVGVPYNEYYEQADQKINNAMDEWLLGDITSDEFADKAAAYVEEEAQKAADTK